MDPKQTVGQMMNVRGISQHGTTHTVEAGIGLDGIIITFLKGQVLQIVLSQP